jgi:hypothetical protein
MGASDASRFPQNWKAVQEMFFESGVVGSFKSLNYKREEIKNGILLAKLF